jgi:hypothetical protein
MHVASFIGTAANPTSLRITGNVPDLAASRNPTIRDQNAIDIHRAYQNWNERRWPGENRPACGFIKVRKRRRRWFRVKQST